MSIRYESPLEETAEGVIALSGGAAFGLGVSKVDSFSYRASLQTHLTQQPIQQLIIQPQFICDLIGFHEDRLGFRGGDVSEVLADISHMD